MIDHNMHHVMLDLAMFHLVFSDHICFFQKNHTIWWGYGNYTKYFSPLNYQLTHTVVACGNIP